MKVFNQKIIIKFLLLILFTNCEKEVEIDLPKHQPELVLNCLFSQDAVFKVHLSKTAPILNDFPVIVREAIVQLYENELFIEELTFDGNIYTSTILPKTNKNYHIKVNTPEFENITAYDYTPSKPNLISVAFNENAYTDEEGYEMGQLTIEFKDNPNKKNYYEIVFFVKDNNSFFTPYYDEKNNDPVLLNEEILAYEPESLMFSDELFNGTAYTLKINSGNLFDSNDEPSELNFIFRHITENYYKYKKRLILHKYNQEHDVWDGVGEPISMYTNIENGYGIFAGYSEITRIIKSN